MMAEDWEKILDMSVNANNIDKKVDNQYELEDMDFKSDVSEPLLKKDIKFTNINKFKKIKNNIIKKIDISNKNDKNKNEYKQNINNDDFMVCNSNNYVDMNLNPKIEETNKTNLTLNMDIKSDIKQNVKKSITVEDKVLCLLKYMEFYKISFNNRTFHHYNYGENIPISLVKKWIFQCMEEESKYYAKYSISHINKTNKDNYCITLHNLYSLINTDSGQRTKFLTILSRK